MNPYAGVVHASYHVVDLVVDPTSMESRERSGRRRREVRDVIDLAVELRLRAPQLEGEAGVPVDRPRHMVVVDGRILAVLGRGFRRATADLTHDEIVAERSRIKPALAQEQVAPAVRVLFRHVQLPGRNRATGRAVAGAGAEVSQGSGVVGADRIGLVRAGDEPVGMGGQRMAAEATR